MIKTTTALTTLLAFLAAPALAGNTTAPIAEPVIAAPVPLAPRTPNWTGFYAGGQLGYANLDSNSLSGDDGLIGGLVLGYDYDLGNNWVVGGGLDYDFTDIDLGPVSSLEEIFRAKLRAGYKIGNGLLYGTGGYAWADSDNLGSDDGYFIGGGYEHMITQNFSVGGEVLYHQFDNFSAPSGDIDLTTVQARATFRF
ncbi:MAG: porin family protein [Rhodobacteraceae bacterium CG17_big_fil_post_rev_8_21_14_2_50_63_15]|nr:porin family protein [Roseovarius sp.]PIV79601.1 MAG: porin family protein [Rhodobacteraceae bacterium CG17_big_fil_post_rev_8_21_14_2_50_63_15]